MRTFSKLTILATLTLAIAFNFSCSGGDNSGGEQKCGGVVYDTNIYRCEAGELIGKCKGADYYPAYQQCVGGVVVDEGSSSPSVGSSSSSVANVVSSSSANGSSFSSVGGSGGGGNFEYGSLPYGGKTYKTVKIGTQTWMAENLNYNASGSKCSDGSTLVDENTATCDTYGRLYEWSTAMTVCPSGWHLPGSGDWNILVGFAENYWAGSGDSIAGKKLKATSGWNYNGNGTDDYGFSALPGGSGYSNSPNYYSNNVGLSGSWWSSTLYIDGGTAASERSIIYYRDGVYSSWTDNRTILLSVRCVKDD